jgi:hypothetical protein
MLGNTETKKIYLLGLDPGSKNFAYSILEAELYVTAKGTTIKINPIETGLVGNTITSMRTAKSELRQFLTDLEFLCNRKNTPVQGIILEQFQSRGVGTYLIEKVNVMIGAILTHFSYLDIDFFSAAAWKISVKKKFDLDTEYKRITCTPHELDATLIGAFGSFKLLKIPPYNAYTSNYLEGLARRVEDVSKTPLRKRKFKGT